jgi:transposase
MNTINFLSSFWQGFQINDFTFHNQQLWIHLIPTDIAYCGSCGRQCSSIHDTTERKVRDLSCFEYQTYLKVQLRRVECPFCGIKTELISWLKPYARITERLRSYVEGLCCLLPISHVAQHLNLHWSTVKDIDKSRLIRDVPEPDYTDITHLMMDEFALHKGHRYATVIADAHSRQVLWIGEGRSRENIRPFFDELGAHCHNIKAVAMDMNTSFDLEVKKHCPQAEVVYDLFHVIAKYGREVIDRVRVDRANELKNDKQARRFVKQGRWLLLKNHENLKDGQDVKLQELLNANQPLSVVYMMKQALKDIWFCTSVKEAFTNWKSWFRQVRESNIPALKQFARKLRPYARGILASAMYPLNTSVLEGMNNKIKVIKRMAYGYRDTFYFFLKIKDAFPGKT